MKIIVVSDSHGNKEKIDFIFKNFKFDYFFFLGDGVQDVGNYANLENVFIVRGNCDFFNGNYKDEMILDIDGLKFLLVHGDDYGVKHTFDRIVKYAKEKNIDVVCFGHSHTFTYEIIDNITLINPGSLKKNLFEKSSAIILEVEDGKLKVVPFIV